MRMRLVALVVAVAILSGCAASAEGPTSETFHSAALGRTMRYQISVPAGGPGTRFPVVYLLHGHGGNETDWFAGTKAADIANGL
jgi:poly(3-hydroxybutyrate) depolymerase